MKRRIFIISVAAVIFVSTIVTAQTKADLSGRWVMDQAQSQGLPPDMDQIMTITHKGDQLAVQIKIYPSNTPNVIRDDIYNLDGKSSPYSQMMGNGEEAKGTRVAQWSADGRGIEVIEELSFQSPRGPAQIKRTFKWSLSADGKTLTIELDQTSPQPAKNKRVFVKK
ncbi:MAG TPA: hypothetical protein VID27_21855 [Blastocatellia bacterium]